MMAGINKSCVVFVVMMVALLANNFHPVASAKVEDATKLLRLLQEKGLKPEHLKLELVEGETYLPYGLGVRASEDIQAGDLLLSIPKELTIRSSQLGQVFPQAVNHAMLLTESTYMLEIATTLVLLYEKHVNKESIWGPYFAVLPTPDQLKNHSLYWSDAAVAELKGSSWSVNRVSAHREAVETAHRICQDLTKESENTKNLMTPQACTLDEVRWGLAIVLSRVWKAMEDNQAHGFLIPFFDILGHRKSGSPVATYAKEGTYGISAVKNYTKGEEVFTSYGSKATFLTVLDYGIVPPPSEWSLQVTSFFAPDTPFGALQASLLRALGCTDNSFSLDLNDNINRGGFADYVACRRLEQLAPTDYAKFHNPNMTYNDLKRVATSIISLENELKTIRKLRSDITGVMSAYSTTIEADDQLVKTNLAPDMYMAVSLRRAEKYVWYLTNKKLDKLWLRLVR